MCFVKKILKIHIVKMCMCSQMLFCINQYIPFIHVYNVCNT